ncbi:MAG: YgdI/YgdR family lipoprotein, partial [Lachnospiraceae bacterium]|nr:YgdI/YgdR family lipoprotein [Lachnospiraceae bacterium]
MKKKFIAMLLAATMVFSLAGCGDDANKDNNGGSSTPADTTPAADNNGGQDESTPEPAADEVEKPSEITVLVDGTVFT